MDITSYTTIKWPFYFIFLLSRLHLPSILYLDNHTHSMAASPHIFASDYVSKCYGCRLYRDTSNAELMVRYTRNTTQWRYFALSSTIYENREFLTQDRGGRRAKRGYVINCRSVFAVLISWPDPRLRIRLIHTMEMNDTHEIHLKSYIYSNRWWADVYLGHRTYIHKYNMYE